MVRRYVFRLTLAVVALLGARPASAAPITFTGHADTDFPSDPKQTVTLIDNPDPVTGLSNPNDVAQQGWMTRTNGWNMDSLRLSYDKATDTMYVGIHFFGIAGDADGDGDPGHSAPQTLAAGGVDLPHLGGRESITVGFDLDNNKKIDVVAGVPADKTHAGPGLDGFNVAAYNNSGMGIQFGYGTTLAGHVGALAFDPDASRPDFEFSIKNFSSLPGLDMSKGFSVSAFAGTPDDIVAGEDNIPLSFVKVLPNEPQQIPEPATLLAWSLVAGGAAWRFRRGRRAA